MTKFTELAVFSLTGFKYDYQIRYGDHSMIQMGYMNLEVPKQRAVFDTVLKKLTVDPTFIFLYALGGRRKLSCLIYCSKVLERR